MRTWGRAIAAIALVAMMGIGAAAMPATAAVSPDEQWVTDVSGTFATPGVITFGSSGVTAALSATAGRCGGANNEATHAELISRLANTYYTPTAPTDAVGVAECLLGQATGSRTVILNKPIAGLILHVQNLDASLVDFAGAPGGGAIQLTRLNSNVALTLVNSGTRLINGPNQGTANCTDNAAAVNNPGCGSYRMTEAGGPVTSFSFVNTTKPGLGADGWFWSLSFHRALLTKAFAPAAIAPGAMSTLTFTVANANTEGAIPFDGVDFSDALPPGVELANSTVAVGAGCGAAAVNGGSPAAGDTSVSVTNATIAVGATCAVSVNVTASTAGTYVNVNSDVVTSLGNLVPDAAATLRVVVPTLSLLKTATLTSDLNGNLLADQGDEITYAFEVGNTGDVPIRDVAIDDSRIPVTSPATADLLPAQTVTFTAAPYVVTRADVLAGSVANTATAAGVYDTLAGEQPVVSNASSTSIGVGDSPSLTIDKTATLVDLDGNGRATLGDGIRYDFAVTNTGNVPLDDVTVADAAVTGLTPASTDGVLPGQVTRFTADVHTITARDVARGEVVNVASALGTAPGGVVIRSLDDSVATPTSAAQLALTGIDNAASTAATIAVAAALLALGALAAIAGFRRNRLS